MMTDSTAALIPIGIGIISILGALLNWRIVVGSGKLIPRLLGSGGAKLVMIVAGLVLILVGVAMMTNLI